MTTSLEERAKAHAYAVGFDLAGIAPLGPAETASAFDRWIEAGYAGDMHYLERSAERRRDTRAAVPAAQSAIVVGLDYGGRAPPGPIARYARGNDYHDVMLAKLDELQRLLGQEAGAPVHGRAYVDTGPILERDLARRAGLGWFGKNTNLINPERGSFFFIGALFVDLALRPDAPFATDHCGTCTRCLDACPTAAFTSAHSLDATRCISYLTIETKGAIPAELRPLIGDLLYGCDICQDVCPWNEKFSLALREDALRPRPPTAGKDARTLARDILGMTEEDFRLAFKGSPMKRARLRGLKRNAAVVLGNIGVPEDVDTLTRALEDPETLVREHAAWALKRIVD
jgi:epoxyqueuosine reductase